MLRIAHRMVVLWVWLQLTACVLGPRPAKPGRSYHDLRRTLDSVAFFLLTRYYCRCLTLSKSRWWALLDWSRVARASIYLVITLCMNDSWSRKLLREATVHGGTHAAITCPFLNLRWWYMRFVVVDSAVWLVCEAYIYAGVHVRTCCACMRNMIVDG